MALTATEIESSSPDAWSGKTTSLVYEDEATVSAYLTKRGLTEFSSATETEKVEHLIKATDAAEDAIRIWFRGASITVGQGLLFPAQGAYDDLGNLLLTNEAPRRYLDGIALLAEESKGGRLFTANAGASFVKREWKRTGGVEYRDAVDPNSLEADQPQIWNKIRAAIPALI